MLISIADTEQLAIFAVGKHKKSIRKTERKKYYRKYSERIFQMQ